MPCILKVKVGSLKTADYPYSTDPVRVIVQFDTKSFPQYATAWVRADNNGMLVFNEDFRYEVLDDGILQDHPLQLLIINNSGRGNTQQQHSLYIDLNPLLAVNSPYTLSGWFPIEETSMSLNVQVKLLFFGDSNPFKDSSAGVQFFSSLGDVLQQGTMAISLIGLVDYEVVSKRAISNDSSQLMYEMAGQVRRQLGRKVLEMGGNAVIAYEQLIDVDGDSLYYRGLGTACKIQGDLLEGTLLDGDFDEDETRTTNQVSIHSPPHTSIDILTVSDVPEKSILSIGGLVSAKAVKISEPGCERERWIMQLREEVKAHCRLLNCQVILGYYEHIEHYEQSGVIVLSVSGTACRVDPHIYRYCNGSNHQILYMNDLGTNSTTDDKRRRYRNCLPCHVPFKRHQAPFENTAFCLCRVCNRRFVPEMILASVSKPIGVEAIGVPVFLSAAVCKPLQYMKAPSHQQKQSNTKRLAGALSVALPFIEYELHRQLALKVRLLGVNAVFGLKMQMTFDDEQIIAFATGFAYHLKALPTPPPLKIVSPVMDLKDRLDARATAYRELYTCDDDTTGVVLSDSSDSTSSSSSSSSSASSSSSDSESGEDRRSMALLQIDDDDADEEILKILDIFSDHVSITSDSDGDTTINKQLVRCVQVDPHQHHASFELLKRLSVFENPVNIQRIKLLSNSTLEIILKIVQLDDNKDNLHEGVNYGQVTCHLTVPSDCTITDLLKYAIDHLKAYVRGLGADKVSSVKINHYARDSGDHIQITISGDAIVSV